MSDEDAYRRYLCRIYSMPEEQADQWNVSQVPAWFVKQRQRAGLVAGFAEKVREAFREAEKRWPKHE